MGAVSGSNYNTNNVSTQTSCIEINMNLYYGLIMIDQDATMVVSANFQHRVLW